MRAMIVLITTFGAIVPTCDAEVKTKRAAQPAGRHAQEFPDSLDLLLESLRRAEEESPDVRAQLYEAVPLDGSARASERTAAVSCSDDLLKRVSDLIEGEVRARREYDSAAWSQRTSKCHELSTSGVTYKVIVFPERRLSATSLVGELTANVWVCPDGDTARRVAWLRRGGAIRDDGGKTQIIEPDRKGRLLGGDGYAGAVAYEYQPRLMINVPLEKDSDRASPDRFGLARGRVVVEVATSTYFRDSGKQVWVTTGTSRTERATVLDILHKTDETLVALQDR